jgi:hypothetical protein
MSDCYAEEDQTSRIRIKLRLSQPISTLHKVHATNSGALVPEMSAWLRCPRNHDDTGAVLSLRSRFNDPTFCSSLARRTGGERQAVGDVGARKCRARGEQKIVPAERVYGVFEANSI